MRFSCKCDFEYFCPKHSASHLLAFSHVFWNTCHPLWRKMQSPFFNVTAGSQPAELENLFIPPRENPRRSPLHVTWALDIFSSLVFYSLCLASLLITLPFFHFYFSYINVETECLSLLNLLCTKPLHFSKQRNSSFGNSKICFSSFAIHSQIQNMKRDKYQKSNRIFRTQDFSKIETHVADSILLFFQWCF